MQNGTISVFVLCKSLNSGDVDEGGLFTVPKNRQNLEKINSSLHFDRFRYCKKVTFLKVIFLLSLKIFKSHENVQISRNRARARPEQQQQPATPNSSPGASAGPGIQ